MTINKLLRELAEKATPGPWWIDSHGHRMSAAGVSETVFIASPSMGEAKRHPETGNLSHWPNDWDASFIAAANPATILALLDAYEALQAELANMERDYLTIIEAQDAEHRKQLARLQAECDLLRKHLQNLIDQTTPLEPVPGNPMWSRRIQLDEVIAERDQLRAECEKLRKDAERIDWLADPNNSIGNVQLPMAIVRQHLHSLRDAIDAAMQEPPK